MIRRITAASIAVLALAAPAAANVPHPGQYERQTISTTLCQTPQVLKTRVIGSADVVTRIQATVNGHGLTGWLEAKRTAGLGGYGVVAQVAFMRKTGPATVRLASARPSCARVRVVIVWKH